MALKGELKCKSITLKGKLNEGIREVPVEGGFDYNNALNKPKINDIELSSGNHTLEELGIQEKGDYITQNDIADFVKKNVDDLENYTNNTDLERDYAKKTEIPSTDGFIKKDVTELDNFYDQTQVDDKIDEETRDLLQGLSRELKPDEENGGFSSQTTVSVKNKSGATELIMEIDNLDVKTDVATNSVLGTLKGQDLEDRLKALETQMTGVNERLDKLTNLGGE